MTKHQLPPLPYDYDALEPYIDAKTMEIHHTKHHQAYIDKLNSALENHSDLQDKSAEELLKNINSVPAEIKQAIINHAGGHANHSFFWQVMTPLAPTVASGTAENNNPPEEVKAKLDSAFSGFSKFQEEFNSAATSRFGSGWAWLVKDNSNNLKVISTANQDSPLMENLTPILGLDVWEHAYYLKYQSKRGDYISAWWNVVNWTEVNKRI
jgi:Fe-Mn family superoxide dismutase